jgi:beta-phosphoglucomutase-like phosphatase (HAD superfamily)
MLDAIEFPYCIASSGPPEKIRQALTVTGLARYFGDRFFSSYTVGSWKPDPGLFLHVAAAMGFSPEHCVVVEDSLVGIEAAVSAGMRALHYAPSVKTARNPTTFSSMSELSAILQGMGSANA